ncbi:MAG: EAL domain-containing protein [Oscillospiraceae bacterium]|nr:EAL domain-containing protein [Oscillospiraceae bacterium]
MNTRMTEEELLQGFSKALQEGHIFVCYQPKVNHATGRMIGAEALMRWQDPEHGMQYPSDFIPVLEQHDLINKADLAIFEQVCRFQRRCLDEDVKPVPISVNMSRYDIFRNNYLDEIEVIRKKYDIPVKLLHVEITESSAIGGMELVSDVLQKLHAIGYVVEMDDFGSGYSSLNVLKDLAVDVIKLDMRFLSGNIGGRGGTIISSMVQMTKWLGTPAVAEGVETIEQADYMKSIGCCYVQGYLYSKPVPEDEFIRKIVQYEQEPMVQSMDLISVMDAGKFWDPNSMETLIFNNYVGGAAIFSFQNCHMEILRVNQKYIKEIGMNLTEKEILRMDPCDMLDDENKRIYQDALQRAIETGEEQTCETWRKICSKTCGEDKICIRSFIRMIGKAGDQYLFYAMVQNVTAEKKRYEDLYDSERRFRYAIEQVNVYAWEYYFATKQMRPCFRCMRDLHLPPVVENYPDSAFECGIFPMDYYDMYHEMLRKLENGEKEVEAVIPLTVGRIPFRVRYTTEFDETGRPLKAYGSAALIIDETEQKEGA